VSIVVSAAHTQALHLEGIRRLDEHIGSILVLFLPTTEEAETTAST
jgi:hypothetical protein